MLDGLVGLDLLDGWMGWVGMGWVGLDISKDVSLPPLETGLPGFQNGKDRLPTTNFSEASC